MRADEPSPIARCLYARMRSRCYRGRVAARAARVTEPILRVTDLVKEFKVRSEGGKPAVLHAVSGVSLELHAR